ncbi:MAG: hypothetical protein WC455_26580 [Dehalococcoidia bacterium]
MRVHYVRGFFALGFGMERTNTLEHGKGWHIKIFLGPFIVMSD